MAIRKIPRVLENIPLYDILNEFQKGHSHIAVVYRDLNKTKEPAKKTEDTEYTEVKSNTCDANTSLSKEAGDQATKKSPPATPAFKKKHRGCSYGILDLENSPIPEFPPNEVVLGVITMEDVIEELLQEEILDETDEYVNIHNRIKINMNASQEKLPDGNTFGLSSTEVPDAKTPQ